jgi:amino acid transporter
VDKLLPAAFGRIHPRWGTPHISMLLLGGVATFLVIGVQTGESLRGAYEALVSLMVIASFLPTSTPAHGGQVVAAGRLWGQS